jgi:hypothetical protein
MPATEVIYFAEQGISPFLEWLDRQQERVQDKVFDAVARLEELGHQLRRPEAEYLGDQIHELRVKRGHVNYRPLYFFDDVKDEKTGRISGRRAVIVHGCTKEGKVGRADLRLAAIRRAQYLADRTAHTFVPPAG